MRRYTRRMKGMIIATGVAIVAVAITGYVFLNSNGKITSPTQATMNAQAAVMVPFTQIVQGARSTVDVRTNYLISSTSQLDRLWTMIDAKGKPPVVDFASATVIAAFAGDEPSSGYNISIEKVEDAAMRTVTIALEQPTAGCAGKKATTTPYILAEVPKTSLPFTHRYVATTTACR